MKIILYNMSQSQVESVKTAIERIKDAKEALCKAVGMPNAEPDDKAWDEFFRKPAADRVTHIISLLIDAENFALPLTTN